jgi:hypothetical protein
VRDAIVALTDVDEVRCSGLAARRSASRITVRSPKIRVVRNRAYRFCDYLHVTKAPYCGLEFPVERSKCGWPTFEQASSATDITDVTLVDLTKAPYHVSGMPNS